MNEQELDSLRDIGSEEHEEKVLAQNPNGFTVSSYCNGDTISWAYQCGFDHCREILNNENQKLREALALALPLLKTYDSGEWKSVADKVETLLK